jgi:sulfoxide reductase heme-binding subunit YedZ
VHLSSSPALWYSIRASGVVAFVLLTCTVLVGVGLAGKVRLVRWPRFTVDALHRYLGTLFWVFLGVHVLTTAVDSYVKLSITDIVVPFASSYRTIGLALGIVATELLLALAIVNRLRDKLSYRFWRRAHYLNFVVWVGSTLHGVYTGTDSLVLLYATAIMFVTAAVGLRLASGGKVKRPMPAAEDRDARRREREARRASGAEHASVG